MRQFLDGALDEVSAYTPALDMDTMAVDKPRGWDADATARAEAQWGQRANGTIRRMTHHTTDVIGVAPETSPSLNSATHFPGSQPDCNVVTRNSAYIQPFNDYWPPLPSDPTPHTAHLRMLIVHPDATEEERATTARINDELVGAVATFLVGMPLPWWAEIWGMRTHPRRVLLGTLFNAYHKWRHEQVPPFLFLRSRTDILRTLIEVFEPIEPAIIRSLMEGLQPSDPTKVDDSPVACLAGGPEAAESVLLGCYTLCQGDVEYWNNDSHAASFWSTQPPPTRPLADTAAGVEADPHQTCVVPASSAQVVHTEDATGGTPGVAAPARELAPSIAGAAEPVSALAALEPYVGIGDVTADDIAVDTAGAEVARVDVQERAAQELAQRSAAEEANARAAAETAAQAEAELRVEQEAHRAACDALRLYVSRYQERLHIHYEPLCATRAERVAEQKATVKELEKAQTEALIWEEAKTARYPRGGQGGMKSGSPQHDVECKQ
jgi:hypothetical protein